MNCEYCNRQLPPGAATCPSCGAEVPGGPVAGNFPAAIPQSPGFKFQLQPGERLISEGSMQQFAFPVISTYMRLTDQRLVFCNISRWLTTCIFWFWFCFLKATTISNSFTREDIVSMEVKPCFGRNKIVIRDKAGNKFEYAGQWFSNRLVQNIMTWWQGGI